MTVMLMFLQCAILHWQLDCYAWRKKKKKTERLLLSLHKKEFELSSQSHLLCMLQYATQPLITDNMCRTSGIIT